MSLPIRGHGATIGIAQEVTWGTSVSRTNWMRLNSTSLERRTIRQKAPTLGTYGAANTLYRETYKESEEAGGSLEWVFGFNDSTLMLLAHVFGAAPTDAGSGPYTHTYALASPTLPGLTLEVIRGVHASLNTAQVFEGCKINTFTMTAEAGRPVICSADIIAETAGDLVAAGSPTYTTTRFPMLHNHFAAGTGVTFDSVAMDARRLTLTINRNLSRNQQLGSLLTAEPVESRLDVTLEFEVLWNSAKPYTALYADTQSDATFTFSNSPRSAAFTMHNAIIDDVSAPTSSAEGISQTVRMSAYADATDSGLGLVITNANQLYTAN